MQVIYYRNVGIIYLHFYRIKKSDAVYAAVIENICMSILGGRCKIFVIDVVKTFLKYEFMRVWLGKNIDI